MKAAVMGAKMGTQKEFKELAGLVFSGEIKTIIDKTFPLKDTAKAHDYLEKASRIGKVLLKNVT